MGEPFRILLVDDHVLFRKGVASLIAGQPGMQVVGEAGDGLEAIRLARQLAPDLILMDIHMPRCSGLEAVGAITQAMPLMRVVMLTVSDDDRDLFTAIKNGAYGYLLKSVEPDQLFARIEGVRHGESPISGLLATRILDEFRQRQRAVRAVEVPDELSEREIEVLRLVVQGSTNREIAAALSVTENTVKIHLRNILEKLHLQNRTQAAAYALRHGLVDE